MLRGVVILRLVEPDRTGQLLEKIVKVPGRRREFGDDHKKA